MNYTATSCCLYLKMIPRHLRQMKIGEFYFKLNIVFFVKYTLTNFLQLISSAKNSKRRLLECYLVK